MRLQHNITEHPPILSFCLHYGTSGWEKRSGIQYVCNTNTTGRYERIMQHSLRERGRCSYIMVRV